MINKAPGLLAHLNWTCGQGKCTVTYLITPLNTTVLFWLYKVIFGEKVMYAAPMAE